MTGLAMDELRSLYEADFYAWTQEQAAALRREAERRANTGLDYENLAEEIESLGRSDRRAVVSNLARVIEHLLKLEYALDADPRREWRRSTSAHRANLRMLLDDSPSLAARLSEWIDTAYPRARAAAAEALLLAEAELPVTCPYVPDELLAPGYWPANQHGLDRDEPDRTKR